MKDVYLLIGGNLGDRKAYLKEAVRLISLHLGTICLTSSLYETAPWGKTDQPAYLNQVIKAKVSMPPAALMQKILDIEKQMGRVRKEKNSERTIDIDILYYGNDIIDQEDLVIPHPRIAERRFVLTPLAECCPEFTDPSTGRTIEDMLNTCSDGLAVTRLANTEHSPNWRQQE